jgi:hypothetical protein
MYGPFRLSISSEAEHLDYEALSNDVQNALCFGRTFNPDEHDIYRFFVIPEFLIDDEIAKLPRKMKRQSYDKANRALVQAERGAEEIRFLGLYPVTKEEGGQLELDLEGEALFEITIASLFKTRLRGATKNKIKRKRHSVLASRTDKFVQWVFLKSWVESGLELGMQVFCSVPTDLDAANRFITCSAKFTEGNRVIESVRNQHISIPVA